MNILTSSRRAFVAGTGGLIATAAMPAQAQRELSLASIAARRGLRFGTAVSATAVRQPDLATLVDAQCAVLVAENEFKWKHIEPTRGGFRFSGADLIAAHAAAHGQWLRGHCIVWNQDNRIPDWQLADEAALTADGGRKLEALIVAHARTMARRYPRVRSWDAVNEVIQLSDGTMRNSLLSRGLGDRFIDIAFAAMRENAPSAQMVYNDYMSWDAKPAHRDGVLRMLEAALKRGVRIDALGVQSHLGPNLGRPRDEAAWRRFLEHVEGLGLDILLTELDCADRGVAARDASARDAEVAAYVKGYLDLTLSFRRVKQVVLWSLSDRDSYVNRPGYEAARRRPDGLPMRPHPYDESLKPKPMRTAIAQALAAAPAR